MLPGRSVLRWFRGVGGLSGSLACYLYLAGASGLACVYFAFPDRHLLLWTPLGASAVAATWVGVRRHRPAGQAAWVLFAAALGCFVTGDTVYNVLTDVLHEDNPFPSLADVFYLAMYPLIGAGLLVLVRSRTVSRDRASLVDALTIATGLGLLSWVYLVLPYFQVSGLTWQQRATSVAYPLGDVLVLAMLARLLVGGTKVRALQLLAVGGGGLLCADVVYGWIQLNGTWQVGGPVDLGWIVYYLAWGAAALHPSMREVGEPLPRATKPLRFGQIVLLGVVSLIAPAMLLGESVSGGPSHSSTVAVFSAVLYLLVIARLFGIVTVHRQSVLRERALRACWETLVAAQDSEQVFQAALAAVPALTGQPDKVRAGFVVTAPDGAGWVATAALHPGLGAELVRAAGGGTPGGRDSGTHVSTVQLDDERGGLLVVRTGAAMTAEAHEALQTLASQVSLMLESIRLAADIRRRQHDDQFKQLIQNASDIILVLAADGQVQYSSPSIERRLGWAAEELAGERFEILMDPADAVTAAELLDLVATRRAAVPPVTDWRLRHREGGSSSFEVVFNNLLDDPLIAGIVLTMRDVSERRELERQLAHQAFHDSLTGLANRSLFQDRAEHAIARAERGGTLVAMVMLDLDDFKIVNDTLGHSAGDELLEAVAHRLVTTLRPGDTVARFGGDEFAVLIEDVTDPVSVSATAERLLARLAEPFTVAGEVVHAGASAGLVLTGGDNLAASLPDLLRQADLALYAAKDSGRGVVVQYHEELSARMLDRVSRKADLRRAVDEGQFQLHYQPIVAIETGEITGAEALVRWMHPERGLIGPGEFITFAEETGLIRDIGGWVLNQACRQSAEWAALGKGLRISVNVSGRQLENAAFVDEVAAAIAEHDLTGGSLVLELTESVLVRDEDGVQRQLESLRSLGTSIAIDDFGVGYSSLGYLQRFPIDILKIDKSFVDNLGGPDSQRGALARAVVSLSHVLRLEVVAEGIERVEQRDELWSLGCGLGQGYLYARPMTATDLQEALLLGTPWGPPGPRTGGSRLAPLSPPRPRLTSSESRPHR